MKRIIKYVFNYKFLIIIPTIAMLSVITLKAVAPYLTKIIVDDILTNGKFDLLWQVLLLLLAVSIGQSISEYFKEYLFDILSTKVCTDIKKDLFDHIQSLSFSYFDNMNTGELMSRIGDDVDNIWMSIAFAFRLFIENCILLVLSCCILFYLHQKLALICVITIIPVLFIAFRLEKKIGKIYEDISDQNAELNTVAQENISGVRLVKAFAREKYEILKFLNMNKDKYKLSMNQVNTMSSYLPFIDFLTNIALVAMVCLGGIFVIKGEMSLGVLVAFNGYIYNLIFPMGSFGWLANILSQTNASIKKISNILDVKPRIKNTEESVCLDKSQYHIKFKNVEFKHDDQSVLRNINLDIKPGMTLAIMGTTGSGKTSLINLIGRYYDVFEGEITIDDINIKKVNLNSLRENISIVSQDTFLFSDTIEENIKLGNKKASEKEIKNACEVACALEFVEDLEFGFKTVIGERGIGLSGGQKQRISIARALLRKSNILILDDATSALDMETEYELLKNLNSFKKNVTTFIIAHRISAVKNADQIIYIEDGEILEKGTHYELLELKGKYYDIYCDQFNDFSELEMEVV